VGRVIRINILGRSNLNDIELMAKIRQWFHKSNEDRPCPQALRKYLFGGDNNTAQSGLSFHPDAGFHLRGHTVGEAFLRQGYKQQRLPWGSLMLSI